MPLFKRRIRVYWVSQEGVPTMNLQAEATFKVDSWEEAIYEEFDDGRKFARATIKKSFEGDLHGEGSLEYLMAYTADGNASFVGMEFFIGGFGKLIGSFMMQHVGTFVDGISTVSLTIVPGSATEELVGLRGEGGFDFGHGDEYPFTLDYYFD
ncbi:MAG: DUF3224 domain-containing protein [Chloroflexi bacterium]|nr:DUF3224 domain-containing protein [Chloroflexota bacterium]